MTINQDAQGNPETLLDIYRRFTRPIPILQTASMAVNPHTVNTIPYRRYRHDYLTEQMFVEGLPVLDTGGNSYRVKIQVRTKDSDEARDAVKACLCLVEVHHSQEYRFTGQEYTFPYPAPLNSFGAYKPKFLGNSVWEFTIPAVETPTANGQYLYQFRLYQDDEQLMQIGLDRHQVDVTVEVQRRD
jgi:hypothetical protein